MRAQFIRSSCAISFDCPNSDAAVYEDISSIPTAILNYASLVIGTDEFSS